MKQKYKKMPSFAALIAVLFFVFTFFSANLSPARAENGNTPQIAPLTPEFQKWLALKKQKKLQKKTSGNHSLGLIPSPFRKNNNSSENKDSQINEDKLTYEKTGFPASYDLRSLGKVSSVKDQGSCGSCWTFATMGSLESHWMVLGESASNLSENNLKECHRFVWTPCEGGNSTIATSYLSLNQGPVSEISDPYSQSEGSCTPGLTPVAYVPDARYLPNTTDVIKQYLTDYGALYTSMYMDDIFYYDSGTHTYYYYGSEDTNHAVTLVGWDDNKLTAGGFGAWIIKNSWGTSWGESGYFYVSYHDTRINSEVTAWTSKDDYSSSKTIYSYDEIGAIGGFGYGDGTDYGVTKFTATSNQSITQLATWVPKDGATISFWVYSGFDGSNLSGLLGSLSNQPATYAGYYTFDLSSPIPISSGNNFYVKVKYNIPGYNTPIPIESAIVGYASPTIETGKNWASDDGGTSWEAIGTGTSYPYDLGIRAYAEQVATPTATPAGGTYSSTQSVTLSSATSGADIYYTINGDTPTIGSTHYTEAISVSATTTLKAIAVKSGMTNSDVMSETYTIEVAIPTATPAGGTYSSTQSVTLATTTSGADIYYTINGDTPTAGSTHYIIGAISISATTTLKAIAVKSGTTDSDVMSEMYTIIFSSPIFRFWSDAKQGHFFTISEAEKDSIIANDSSWSYEGVAYNAFSVQAFNATPIYRFWSSSKQHHFFTASAAEKDSIIANDHSWAYEGIAYYAYAAEQSNTTAVFRFWSDAKQGHFFTTSVAEKDSIIANDHSWAYEGIAWYVPE